MTQIKRTNYELEKIKNKDEDLEAKMNELEQTKSNLLKELRALKAIYEKSSQRIETEIAEIDFMLYDMRRSFYKVAIKMIENEELSH